MLNLKLRQEFTGRRLKGTAIELSNKEGSGATQVAARDFLEITYPTHDVLKGIESIGPDQGRPVVVIGERGSGKSHLLATLHHAARSPEETRVWLTDWARRLAEPALGTIKMRQGTMVISASMHLQEYKFLWDLLFGNHPNGTFIRGKWEGMGDKRPEVPPLSLIEELLTAQPVMLLIDEFQTWYDGLTSTKQYPWRQWAFNFIQLLSEMASNRPDLLVLVVSVRNGDSDAYRQIHRNNPVQIDFKAGGVAERVQEDRRRMLLHRLFENRMHVPNDRITEIIGPHVSEYMRLMETNPSERQKTAARFVEAWPFAPHLLQLLEDQVLVATDAQETRDLIRILANLFKSRGDAVPVITAADFQLDDDVSGIGALLDSVSNQRHRDLRERAQRNMLAVREAVPRHGTELPELDDIMASLWLRSIAVGNMAGAERAMLQVDATRDKKIDDNVFQSELATIIENSFNIHEEGSRLVFRVEENPQAKLMSTARNDRQFSDGSDFIQLAKETRYALAGTGEVPKEFRVVVLANDWISNPWKGLNDEDLPAHWDDRVPILVLPEEPDRIHERLGRFLKDHLSERRNCVRFLIPNSTRNIYTERDLVILARAILKADEWSRHGPEYKPLYKKYQTELRDILKSRFNRVAILERWSFKDPAQCSFHIESLNKTGSDIPERIKHICSTDLWVQEDFEGLILAAARNNDAMGKVLKELREPRPAGGACVPWLGETDMKERIIRVCARGTISINVRGSNLLQANPGESDDAAWKRMRLSLGYTGRQLDEVFLLMPSANPTTGGSDMDTPTGAAGSDAGTGQVDQPGGLWDPVPDQPGTGNQPSSVRTAKARINRVKERTSALNHIGQLESWGIGPATPVQEVTLRISSATGAQLKDILKKLPDGLTFDLSLEQEEP
jgi:energy-coupling factor transporter ATP-binding protein EcfA2